MIDRPLLFFIALTVAGLWSTPAQTQDRKVPDSAASEPTWEAAARYDYDRVSGGRAGWQRWTAVLQRAIPGGTVAATLARQRRFDIADEGITVDLWQDLWGRAYGHLQVGFGPDAQIRPQRSLKAEIYQPVGPWELLGLYEGRRYTGSDVHRFGAGLARYVGPWYLRARTTAAPRQSTWAVSQRVGVRRFYYWTPSASYIDLEGGVGRSVELVGPNASLLIARTAFASLRVQHFLTDRFALTAALRYSDDGPFSRTGGTVGLFARW
ncbi:YaiO family outer membrane beta-barrel protein [Salinibacter ruber]|uniref:YaiO family outer membrane beta-barrel protein n=1 Tax=Salinibacter ruber TaxID=146919 RepID=UPI0016159557|nr:YaiO family outer membrane beta-barrel protein [Salinibacter ruber]MBB4090914.1 YaiO family outer membrane protein [Salinibacter ruber]